MQQRSFYAQQHGRYCYRYRGRNPSPDVDFDSDANFDADENGCDVFTSLFVYADSEIGATYSFQASSPVIWRYMHDRL